MRTLLRNSRTAVVFTAAFGVAAVATQAQSAEEQARWLAWASTNLDNLRHHPVPALLVSAFLTDSDWLNWIGLSLIGLVSAGQVLGNRRLAVLVATSHVAASLVSEGVLAVRIRRGLEPLAARGILDTGASYVVVPALVVGIAYGRWPVRLACAVAFALLSPHLFGGIGHLDVAAVGHCCAILIGLGLGRALRPGPVGPPT